MYLAPVDGSEAMRLVEQGAILVDIRDGEERSRVHIPGSIHASVNQPLSRIGGKDVPAVVYHCSCGRRAEDNAYRLKTMTDAPAYMLRGGLDAWVDEGLPVVARSGLAQIVSHPGQLLMMAVVAMGGAALGFALSPAFESLSFAMGMR